MSDGRVSVGRDPTRLLVTATGFLRDANGERATFVRRVAELLPDAAELTWVPEGELSHIAEWVARSRPDVVVSVGSTQTVSVLSATTHLPVVAWGYAGELVQRPAPELCGFRLPEDTQRESLRVLRSFFPDLRTVAALYDERYPPGTIALAEARAAAGELGLALVIYETQDERQLDAAFADMVARGIAAVRVLLSPFLARQGEALARRALEARVALMSYDSTTAAGGLVSYVPDMARTAVLLGDLACAIAGGTTPQTFGIRACPMKLEINAATARALGIKIPSELAERALRTYE